MNLKKWLIGIGMSGLVAFGNGCGGGSSVTGPLQPQQQTGSAFVIGTDAPLPSVVSFQVDITGISVSDGVDAPVPILANMASVDFARLNGLKALLDINTIPAGTYTTAVVTLANPQIGYLSVTNPQTNPPTPPTVSTLNSTTTPPVSLTTSTVTITLASPLVVNPGDIDGLKFDFDLRHSIQVDPNGQITGVVNPNLSLEVVTPSDADAYIDEFDAGVVSVEAGGNSFVVQGPHGHQFTVTVNSQTEWENGESLANLTTNSIVEISGTLAQTSGAILADTVAILSQNSFYAGGLVTYVDPPTGQASDFDLYVRNTLPSGTGFQSGQISNITLTGNENFFIYWWHLRFPSFLFNSSLMVPGQRVTVGGPFSNGAVTVKRVVLRHEGHTGAWVVGSTDAGAGTFQFDSNGLAGVLFNGPVVVYCTPFTVFKGGLTGLGGLTGSTAIPLRVVGLVLKDPISSQPVFVAHSVELLTN